MQNYYTWMGDQIEGIREIKLWNLFKEKYHKAEKMQKNVSDSYRKNSMCDQKKILMEDMLDVLLQVIVYIVGGLLIVKNQMTIGNVFAFITYCGYVTKPVGNVLNLKYMYAGIVPSAKRYF